MDDIHISYKFIISPEQTEVFDLYLNPESLELQSKPVVVYAEWTELKYHQCPNCTLVDELHCPLMVNISGIVKKLENVTSHDELDLEVFTSERHITQHTTAQRGISSLLGLVMATSPCPHTRFLRPMARFHLPLATEDETIYRAVSMYLLAQYYQRAQGKQTDSSLKGLNQIYQNLQTINASIAERLRAASKRDSSVNALIMLDLYAKAMPYVINESLDELKYLFAPYLEE